MAFSEFLRKAVGKFFIAVAVVAVFSGGYTLLGTPKGGFVVGAAAAIGAAFLSTLYGAPIFAFLLIPTSFLLKRVNDPRTRSAVLLALSSLSIALVYFQFSNIVRCETSFYGWTELRRMLPSKDVGTLKGVVAESDSGAIAAICPLFFTYTKDGRRMEADVTLDEIHGSHILEKGAQ